MSPDTLGVSSQEQTNISAKLLVRNTHSAQRPMTSCRTIFRRPSGLSAISPTVKALAGGGECLPPLFPAGAVSLKFRLPEDCNSGIGIAGTWFAASFGVVDLPEAIVQTHADGIAAHGLTAEPEVSPPAKRGPSRPRQE